MKTMREKTTRLCQLCLSLLPLLWAAPARTAEMAPMFPFVISYDAPDNASSVAHFLEKPAGKHGFVRAEGEQFVTDAGPIRLNGTNLTGPANFPTHEQADRLAARLARFGLNCVRLHYMDADYGNFRNEKQPGIIAHNPKTQRELDATQLDRLDYLVAALKKQGIYVNVNLHVARQWDERDGFPKGGCPWADKGLDNFEPRMIELQKEYARKLLTHPNRYTGLPYADDPCVAMVEINNENALMRQYVSGGIDRLARPYADELRKQWNEWLRRKYGSTAKLRQAWGWEAKPFGQEQIPNGSFDAPIALDGKPWSFSVGEAQGTVAATGGVLRVDITREGNEYFPKLFRQLTVKQDEPYTLSFRIRRAAGKGRVRLGLAIADSNGGWRSLGLHKTLWVGAKWKTVTYAFAANADSQHAQFQVTRFKPGVYEIDNLSFRPGTDSELGDGQTIEAGTVDTIRTATFAPRPARRDFYQFLIDTERAYWTGMARYLKDELHVKSMVSGTQLGYSPPQIQAELDYVDNHSYWCHPSPVNPNWRIRNVSMVNSMACIRGLATQRVAGKPYTVSEYNHPFPNQYGAEGQPMLRAYGRFQGWNGVFEYTYNHRTDFEPQANRYFFSMVARTDVLAHMPACAAIYLRGDVQLAKGAVLGAMSPATYLDRLAGSRTIAASTSSVGLDSRLALLHRTAMTVSDNAQTTADATVDPEQRVVVSDTGELTWNTEEPGAGYFTVNTPNTKLFTGFPAGRRIELGGVSARFGETRLGWATLSLLSRQATGFGETNRAANVLLAVTGEAGNRGMALEAVSGTQVHSGKDWGGPMCVEGVPVQVTLPTAAGRVHCYALDPRGERKAEVPVVADGEGRSRVDLGPQYQTVWYEIDIR
jgi:hypothetical protein